MYCQRCGEEPEIDLELCPECGENLCEGCWGDKTIEICGDCERIERKGVVIQPIHPVG